VGRRYPLHPLVVDQRVTGQAPPPGITVLGPIDMVRNKDHWAMKFLGTMVSPPPPEWPATEAYFDIYLFPEECEFVTDYIAMNAYVWGYLAARN
jgi:endoglucanase